MASPFVRVGLIAASVLVVFCTGYFKGSAHVQSKFDEYRLQVSAAGLAQSEKTAQTTKSQQQVTAKSEATYESNRNAIRALYQRMRVESSSSALSGVSATSQIPNGRAADEISLAPILAGRCAETTEQLISLQSWIIDQSQVNP
jgi:hypothetical protein